MPTELEKFLGLFSDYESPCESFEQAQAIWNAMKEREEKLRRDAASFVAQLDAIIQANDELQAAVDGDNCSPAVLRAIELLDFAIHGK